MADKTCNTCKANKVCDHNKYGFENCENYISADGVVDVRCRDCKYAEIIETNIGTKYIECQTHEVYMEADDFCSYGERRDT